MNKIVAFLSALVAAPLILAGPSAASAASGIGVAGDDHAGNQADGNDPVLAATTAVAQVSPRLWAVRVEGSLVAMRDNWLGLPGPEIGLTVGRDLSRSWSVELTGSARDVDDENRSWSGLAAARWVALASANGRHRLTIAGGPFVEVNHVVHGTMPFAHAELAYVYRAPFGLTVLAGVGPNIALTNSSYVAPPRPACDDDVDDSGGHNFTFDFCLDLGPDAQEMHVGDSAGQMRLAVGWHF